MNRASLNGIGMNGVGMKGFGMNECGQYAFVLRAKVRGYRQPDEAEPQEDRKADQTCTGYGPGIGDHDLGL